jgi:hypothetical protein
VAGPPDPANWRVAGVGYSAQGVTIATWGMTGIMTWAGIANYCSAANVPRVATCRAILAPTKAATSRRPCHTGKTMGAPAGSPHKIVGWLAVDPTNQTEIQTALYLFENLGLRPRAP